MTHPGADRGSATITLGAGKIIYSLTSNGTQDTSLTATKYQILITPQTSLCANAE